MADKQSADAVKWPNNTKVLKYIQLVERCLDYESQPAIYCIINRRWEGTQTKTDRCPFVTYGAEFMRHPIKTKASLFPLRGDRSAKIKYKPHTVRNPKSTLFVFFFVRLLMCPLQKPFLLHYILTHTRTHTHRHTIAHCESYASAEIPTKQKYHQAKDGGSGSTEKGHTRTHNFTTSHTPNFRTCAHI